LTAHIPEPVSATPRTRILTPIMRQSWHHVTFIHWRCDPATARKLIPRGLDLDLFAGDCWVGLVPFLITDLTIPKGPAIPWLSRFPETNVRTYVIDRKGRRGVWFFSLDAARLLAVAGARIGFGLPYFWAQMKVSVEQDIVRYSSVRLGDSAAASLVAIRTTKAPIAAPSVLEVFLTARFRLYAQRRSRLLMAEICHQPWPLQHASIVELQQSLAQAAGLTAPDSAPLVHFAPRVDVIVGPPALVSPAQ
jgi:uncharacterized protein